MDLEISNHSNSFQVKGILNRGNVHKFMSAFLNVFDTQNTLTINVENLTSIDRYGVNALAKLHNESLRKGKKLSIIGMGFDDLYEDFKSDENAA